MDEPKKVAIVEDDAKTREMLRGFFSDYTAENGVSFDVSDYGSGEAFLADERSFDMILMDIELPGRDGMETVRELRKRDRDVIVIFATNMAQFAVKGYEVEAFDFIVKPMTYYNFTIKIRRALERSKTKRVRDIWINVSGAGRRRISAAQLKYVEVMGHRITYHTTEGDFASSGSMLKVKEELSDLPFELCNRCYLVNLKFVEEVRPFQIVVGGETLQVSHLKRNEFMSKLNLYLSTGGGVLLSNIFLNKLLFMVEILVAEILCTVYLKKRSKYPLRLAAYIIVSLAVGAAFPVAVNNFPYACFMFFTLFAITVGLLKLLYNEPWINILFCSVAAYTVQHFAYELANLILIVALRNSAPIFGMYTSTEVDLTALSQGQIIYALIYVLGYYAVYGVFFVIFGKSIKKSGNLEVKRPYLLLVVGIGLIVDIVLNSGYVYLSKGEDFASGLIIYSSNCMCCILLLFVQFGLIRQKSLETELSFVRKLWAQDKEQYELFKENMEMFNLKCHDMKHQIREIGANKGIPHEALEEIESKITVYDSVVKTGNDVLDTILTEKNLKCNRDSITLTCVADGKALSFVSDADLYALFGNALDNAIEAVSRIPEAEKRIIGLSVFASGNFVAVEVHNTFAVAPEFENGMPKTTKAERELHGYGVKSIKLIAEKYGGDLTLGVRDGLFNLNVLLPNNKRQTCAE